MADGWHRLIEFAGPLCAGWQPERFPALPDPCGHDSCWTIAATGGQVHFGWWYAHPDDKDNRPAVLVTVASGRSGG